MRGVLGILLDLLASVDEGVDEEADEEEDEGGQDGVEDEGHRHLTRIFNVMFFAAYSCYRHGHHMPSYTKMMIFWVETWYSSSSPLPEEPTPNQVAFKACKVVIMITTRAM